MDDQGSDTAGTSTEVNEEGTSTTDVKTETQSQEQSNEEREEVSEKMYEDSFGNKLTSDQLYETYNKIIPNYTRISQELAELKKSQQASKAEAQAEARSTIEDNKLLKNVPPDVKEAIVSIVSPVIDQAFQQREAQKAEQEKDRAFDNELKSLAEKYTGKDGLPKFDRNQVLNKMREKGNRDFDPESVYLKLHRKEYDNYLVKQALKQQGGGTQTEITGQSDSTKPSSKTPTSFQEASARFLSRLHSRE
jgi:hypothetical protein